MLSILNSIIAFFKKYISKKLPNPTKIGEVAQFDPGFLGAGQTFTARDAIDALRTGRRYYMEGRSRYRNWARKRAAATSTPAIRAAKRPKMGPRNRRAPASRYQKLRGRSAYFFPRRRRFKKRKRKRKFRRRRY